MNYKKTKKDQEGFLSSYKDWNQKIANQIAKKENISLTKIHWKIIYFTREFYIKFKRIPSIRILISTINKSLKKKLTSTDMINLFPKGIIKQISKISGLPKPTICL